MNCNNFGNLTDSEIKAVLQLTYQLIASANYGSISEADNPSINVMMAHLGFRGPLFSTLGDAYWNDAMDMDPYVAFDTITGSSESKKEAFKNAILDVVYKDNSLLRMDIARQIFNKVKIC